MIQDLSNTLKAILTQPGLPADLAAATISFDSPTDSFVPTQPTVDLFLYDIRENLELRNNEPTITTNAGMATITPPPLRVACSYLVTAWPVGGTDLALQEHQLLSEVLQLLSGYPLIPSNLLQGSLVGQEPPLPMITLHPDALRNLAEFWTSLDVQFRPSLTVTVTIAMNVLPVPKAVPIVTTAKLSLQQQNLPTTTETTYQIAGTVTDSTGAAVSQATVTIVERGVMATTDPNGDFSVGPLVVGTYTLLAQLGTKQKSTSITVPPSANNSYNVQLS